MSGSEIRRIGLSKETPYVFPEFVTAGSRMGQALLTPEHVRRPKAVFVFAETSADAGSLRSVYDIEAAAHVSQVGGSVMLGASGGYSGLGVHVIPVGEMKSQAEHYLRSWEDYWFAGLRIDTFPGVGFMALHRAENPTQLRVVTRSLSDEQAQNIDGLLPMEPQEAMQVGIDQVYVDIGLEVGRYEVCKIDQLPDVAE